MVRHPAWAVGSYSSGPPAAKTVGTKSTGGFHQRHGSPCRGQLQLPCCQGKIGELGSTKSLLQLLLAHTIDLLPIVERQEGDLFPPLPVFPVAPAGMVHVQLRLQLGDHLAALVKVGHVLGEPWHCWKHTLRHFKFHHCWCINTNAFYVVFRDTRGYVTHP